MASSSKLTPVTIPPKGTAAGDGGAVRLKELAVNGSHYVELRAPDALAADVPYVLPDALPATSGQALVSSDTGTLSWEAMQTQDPVTIGTANGLSLVGQALSLAEAGASAGAMSAADKTKLDAITGTNTGDVFINSPANGLGLIGQGLTLATVGADAGAMSPADKNKLDLISVGTVSSLAGTNTGDVSIGTANGLSLAGQVLSLDLAVAGGANGALLGTDKTKLDATSGTNSGDVSLGTANGLSLVGQALSLANAVAAGASGAMTGADKTKLDAITGAHTGTNTGDVTLGTANGLSLIGQSLSMAAASLVAAGVVDTTTQSFAGAKTFSGAVEISSASGLVFTGVSAGANAIDLGSGIQRLKGGAHATGWLTFNSAGTLTTGGSFESAVHVTSGASGTFSSTSGNSTNVSASKADGADVVGIALSSNGAGAALLSNATVRLVEIQNRGAAGGYFNRHSHWFGGVQAQGVMNVSPLATPVNTTHTTVTTGGTLAAGTYWYRISATNAAGETLASTETSRVTTGSTSVVRVRWLTVPGATGYKVYGRTTGAEQLMATLDYTSAALVPVASGNALQWTDDGSVAPSGALPATAPPALLNVAGGIRANSANVTQPAASATYRGQFWVTEGGGGVADVVQCCLKAAGGTYSWVTIGTG